MDEYSRGSLPITVPTDGAVAELPAGRTAPVGVLQGLPCVLPVPIPHTNPTELTSHPLTVSAPADSLGVDGLLTTLVTSRPDGCVVLLLSRQTNFLHHTRSDVLGASLLDRGALRCGTFWQWLKVGRPAVYGGSSTATIPSRDKQSLYQK